MAGLFGSPEIQRLAEDDPEEYYKQTPFVRSLWESRLPTWLGQAYKQDVKPAIDAASAPTMEQVLMAPYNLASGAVKGAIDTIDSAQKDPSDPRKMLELALMSTGTGGLLGRAPTGSLGANVFQGSPHKYGPEGAAKSLDHIGEGEGAHAYGWGRYDAGDKAVAEDYQRNLPFRDIKKSFLEELPEDASFEELIELRDAGHFSKSQEAVISALEKDDFLGFDNPAGAISAAYSKHIGNWDPSDELRAAVNSSGHLYKHDLPDTDIEKYLDYDAPLSEQPDILERVKDYWGQPHPLLGSRGEPWINNITGDSTGRELYSAIEHWTNKAQASESLSKAGIPGLKYLDGNSRVSWARTATPDNKMKVYDFNNPSNSQIFDTVTQADDFIKNSGTRNYVTWDQEVLDRMKLLERDGVSLKFLETGA